jgi:K+-transporting ATPase KdpF subunit
MQSAGVICMTLDYAIGLAVTVGLLVYLTYALLWPEKF